MNKCAGSIRVMHPLFQEGQGGSIPTSALQLRFCDADLQTAIALNRLWHSRLPKVIASNITRNPCWFAFVAWFDGLFYASAIWTNPTARHIPYWSRLELRRFAIAQDSPDNTASRMLGWMTKEIKRRRPEIDGVLSYQDCDVHQGTIYKAAGWIPTVKSFDHRNRGLRSGRKRNLSQTTATKQRWEKNL